MNRNLVFLLLYFFSWVGFADRLQDVEARVHRLQNEVEELRNRNYRQSNYFNPHNRFYAKAGLTLIIPRSRTINFTTDNGFGMFLGVGQYFGSHSVVDLSLDWDLYPALTFRYRYEFRMENPAFSIGPLIGYKVKLAALPPIDNYLDSPASVNSAFFVFGMVFGFPVQNWNLINLELTYLVNGQQFVMMNGAIHFFL